MPSARDQLSKLTATTMSCICIGFMAPSLASNKRSESISNMISLSIFIITVAVNICIQLGTGVIFSFVAEHIIIMCFMFMLLVILWLCIYSDKEFISEGNVEREEIKYVIENIELVDFAGVFHVLDLHLAIEVCVDDMNKWMNLKRDPSPMVDMLRKLDDCSTTTPQLKDYLHVGKLTHGDKYNVTCLSMVVLVKVVAASVLDPSIAIMRDTLGEALEIIYYVDRKMDVRYEDSRERQLARKFWKEEYFDRSMKLLNTSEDTTDPVSCAISKIKNASDILPEFASHEGLVVWNFFNPQRYATIEGLCSDVRRLFSEMLRHFLVQLPICVFKDVREGSIEDCEKRARYLTKRLCKLNPLLEDEVQWKFPDGWPPNNSRIFDGGSSAPVQNVLATTAQNVLMPQANEQQPADEILPANASNNV
ncbi:hypothetical protein Sjap_025711 [Stephania japonica]